MNGFIQCSNGHYYRLNSDGKTASFVCWSKEALDVYHDYMRFYDWFIECALDDVQEVNRQIEHFAVVRIKSNSPIFNIPREIVYKGKTYPIVRIGSGAFAFCEITSISIPDTIVYIETRAFFRCDGLKQLIIPDSVVGLANNAISECKNLETITWRGLTYEDDIDEPFLFPDHKDKYAIIKNIYDKYDDLCPPSWWIEETNIPRCPHCGEPIRKNIPNVNWPIVGSIQGGAYDYKVPWNYQWNGICENCGHGFNIKMAQDLEREGI